ncbi:MAG: antibiotic ABC transporter ATP-binding protein [Gammaproteobacteria bacterium CG11_big_fil_rev_8_21_14_0_20_46_22]|nr:MAG: antibiotic ABC transporter ATP-binding protein [Gammaproteobacteria bacterium CG12_big_fil_rev_8_21_14_0_65_46_12]PIR11789.1 MAG: antibiotic ABC transporter ATP-binding protein [Gammaproteobacteria bacterium CG11_big_fil_rev_8_21_14_0_20_46_22]
MHTPILLNTISLSFGSQCCFDEFSAEIYPGQRIAIIGRNGSGKSSLMKLLRGQLDPSSGEVIVPEDVTIGYVEQTIDDYHELSGGQRFNQRLSEALALQPNALLLDEPTNHLDRNNRKSLIRMLKHYYGTIIMITHDKTLIEQCADTLWHIDNQQIHTFSGHYEDYIQKIKHAREHIEKQLDQLKREKKDTHEQLMREQQRATKSKRKGEKSVSNRKWPTITSHAKARRAEQTTGRKKAAIDDKRQTLNEQLAELRLPEVILPTFHLDAEQSSRGEILSVRHASLGYKNQPCLLNDINLSVSASERVAITGENGSGKSTLLKALLQNKEVSRQGDWRLPEAHGIGYLDQHYNTLNQDRTVIEALEALCSHWDQTSIRQHLSDFLFRQNEAVNTPIPQLSGGEKARLSLCLIAARSPKLLILDEITNNLDLETKEHVTQILRHYPGSLIVVSHDDDFLDALDLDRRYTAESFR